MVLVALLILCFPGILSELLWRGDPTSKYCTSSNKTPFPAVQMKKISLKDTEPTVLPLL